MRRIVGPCICSAPAFAQDAPEASNNTEIVVTAQRREETANSVGMGIQAFTGDHLEQLHVARMYAI